MSYKNKQSYEKHCQIHVTEMINFIPFQRHMHDRS